MAMRGRPRMASTRGDLSGSPVVPIELSCGRSGRTSKRPLSLVKRTFGTAAAMSANDPYQTSTLVLTRRDMRRVRQETSSICEAIAFDSTYYFLNFGLANYLSSFAHVDLGHAVWIAGEAHVLACEFCHPSQPQAGF